jgi:hypothetical protein
VRTPDKPQRFLRQLYADPFTNSSQWGEVRLPSGQLVGVFSQSGDAPLKVAGFALRDKDLADKEHYSDWVFRSALPAANPLLAAGQGYSTPGAPSQAPAAAPAPSPRPNNTPTPPGFIQPLPRPR